MSIIKNQHYVPRFYLKEFSNNNEQLWVYDKSGRRSFFTKVENVANENFFYDFEELDIAVGKQQSLEKIYSRIENIAAPVFLELLRSLNNNNFSKIDFETKRLLCEFLVIQIMRTKEFREYTYQLMYKTREKLISEGFTDNDLQRYGLDKSSVQKKKLHIDAIFSDLKISLIDTLNNHICLILYNKTSLPLYTSDNPIVKKAHCKDSILSMDGYGSRGIEVAFPLSPKWLFILIERTEFKYYEQFENGKLEFTDEENVIYYNSLQVSNSYRQVYCNVQNFELAIDMIKKIPELANPDRRRIIIN